MSRQPHHDETFIRSQLRLKWDAPNQVYSITWTMYLEGTSALAQAARQYAASEGALYMPHAHPGGIVLQSYEYPYWGRDVLHMNSNYTLKGVSPGFAAFLQTQSSAQQRFFRHLAYSTMCFTLNALMQRGIITPDTDMALYARGIRSGADRKLLQLYERWGLVRQHGRHFIARVDDLHQLCQQQASHSIDPDDVQVVETEKLEEQQQPKPSMEELVRTFSKRR